MALARLPEPGQQRSVEDYPAWASPRNLSCFQVFEFPKRSSPSSLPSASRPVSQSSSDWDLAPVWTLTCRLRSEQRRSGQAQVKCRQILPGSATRQLSAVCIAQRSRASPSPELAACRVSPADLRRREYSIELLRDECNDDQRQH